MRELPPVVLVWLFVFWVGWVDVTGFEVMGKLEGLGGGKWWFYVLVGIIYHFKSFC